MFKPGTYEYGLKTGDLSEQEIIKIFKKANSKITKEIHDSRIPKGLNIKNIPARLVVPRQIQNRRNMIISIGLAIG